MPVYGVGHSLGALTHLLIGEMFTSRHSAVFARVY